MAALCLGDGKAEVEHEADRLVIGIGLPAVAWQELQIETGQIGNDIGVLASDGLGVLTAGEYAADEQTGLRIAFLV